MTTHTRTQGACTGIHVVLFDYKSERDRPAWERWWRERYLPAVRDDGAFDEPSLFMLAPSYEPPRGAHVLTIAETSAPDATAAYRERQAYFRSKDIKLLEQHPALRIEFHGVFTFASVAGQWHGRRLTGLTIANTRCTDPASEAAFERWYDEHHLADIVGGGGFYAGARCVDPVLGPGEPRHIAIYKTDLDTLGAASEATAKTRATRTPTPSTLERIWGAGFLPYRFQR